MSLLRQSEWGNGAKMAIITEKSYHMNALVEGNLQQSLMTYDLMNSFKK